MVKDLGEFEVTAERGFLPSPDPLDRLPSDFEPWEAIAQNLPRLLVAAKVRAAIESLPVLDASRLGDERQIRRAMMALSFAAHAYVWGDPKPVMRIPAALSVPWHRLSQRLGRPPVLSYASYALDNWKRLDPKGPAELGNIVVLQHFLGGLDEQWFILIHVAIEAKAGPALAAVVEAQKAVLADSPAEVTRYLGVVAQTLQAAHEILLRMPEGCDPYIYYNRVRPYLHGWASHPSLPEGIVYEGVDDYAGKPRSFRGETGAQSSLIPLLDAALGVMHAADLLRTYLIEMRNYMPPKHRAFIDAVEAGPSIRNYVLERRATSLSLRDAYNAAVDSLRRFRSTHLEYADRYIFRQRQRGALNPVAVGTGGTPFMPYLRKHRDETSKHRIK
ncbi:MAG: hypothetical protein HYV04_10755 [Deltaproteobacteria bacterium]|nr:hypothetical protein [Deltaproteobacteria bacterium]